VRVAQLKQLARCTCAFTAGAGWLRLADSLAPWRRYRLDSVSGAINNPPVSMNRDMAQSQSLPRARRQVEHDTRLERAGLDTPPTGSASHRNPGQAALLRPGLSLSFDEWRDAWAALLLNHAWGVRSRAPGGERIPPASGCPRA
jgi:hypothetical protein